MKRIPTIVLALLVILACDFGASCAHGRTEWGLKIGLDFDKHYYSGLSSESRLNTNNHIGLALGIFLTQYISSRVAFQPELYYAIRGFTEQQGNGRTYIAKEKVRLDCLELSLLWKFLIGSGTPQPNLFIGPDVALFVYNKSVYHQDQYYNGVHYSYSSSRSGSGGWDRWGDVGMVVGGGLDFPVGKGKILVDTRCNLLLTRIFFDWCKENTIETMFSLRVGYAF